MTLHIHTLAGCTPAALAPYLKALGILRLVSEQLDSSARAAWHRDQFVLVTKHDRAALEHFLLHDYWPTPILAPWNKGNGLAAIMGESDEDEPDAVDATRSKGRNVWERLAAGSAPRLEPYARALAPLFTLLPRELVDAQSAYDEAKAAERGEKGKALNEAKKHTKAIKANRDALAGAFKATLQHRTYRLWSDDAREWFDACSVMLADGTFQFPALLGTGGNDGRLDFGRTFAEQLDAIIDLDDAVGAPRAKARAMLTAALDATPIHALPPAPIGQFHPGRAGGPNMGSGFDGGARVNPWDIVLLFEGTLALSAGLTRRASTEDLPKASAPFAVEASASGYASSGSEKDRGEQWMPLWTQPATYTEVRGLLREYLSGGEPSG